MTEAFIRVKRKDKWENIEVEHLTKEERAEIIGSRSAAEIMNWLDMTCDVIVAAEKAIERLTK